MKPTTGRERGERETNIATPNNFKAKSSKHQATRKSPCREKKRKRKGGRREAGQTTEQRSQGRQWHTTEQQVPKAFYPGRQPKRVLNATKRRRDVSCGHGQAWLPGRQYMRRARSTGITLHWVYFRSNVTALIATQLAILGDTTGDRPGDTHAENHHVHVKGTRVPLAQSGSVNGELHLL